MGPSGSQMGPSRSRCVHICPNMSIYVQICPNMSNICVSASNSGFRRNNPHPSQDFLAWKLPRGGPTQQVMLCSPASFELHSPCQCERCQVRVTKVTRFICPQF